ncbi:hypothetical protein BH10ACT7_BH10ACT7_04300 [soil metagenome]
MFAPQSGALGLGGVTRCLALATMAATRGHRVSFLVPPSYALLNQYPVGDRIATPRPDSRLAGVGEASSLLQSLEIRGMLDPDYMRSAVKAELDAYRKWKPDVVITENQLTVPISAAVARIPFAATAATINLDSFSADGGRFATTGAGAAVHAILRESGLDDVETVEQLMHEHASLNIAPTIHELEPLLTALPQVLFAGPILFSPVELARGPVGRRASGRRVLVYLSKGLVTLENLAATLAAAFPAHSNTIIVAEREARQAQIAEYRRSYGMLVARMPGLTAALSNTDLVVTRGGQNMLMASLLAGRPIIGTPGGSAEPMFNLAALESYGAAVSIPGVPTAGQFAEAVAKLDSHDAPERSRRLGAQLRRHLGAADVLRVLEAW